MTDSTSTSPTATARDTARRQGGEVVVAVVAGLILHGLTGGAPAGAPTSVDVSQVVVCGTPHP